MARASPPASSGLKARLEATVTSTLCTCSALYLYLLSLSVPSWLRADEQGPTFHWASFSLTEMMAWEGVSWGVSQWNPPTDIPGLPIGND